MRGCQSAELLIFIRAGMAASSPVLVPHVTYLPAQSEEGRAQKCAVVGVVGFAKYCIASRGYTYEPLTSHKF
jgi:hypothetical protein